MYYAANRKPKDSETLALVEIAIYCATVNQENEVLKVSNTKIEIGSTDLGSLIGNFQFSCHSTFT